MRRARGTVYATVDLVAAGLLGGTAVAGEAQDVQAVRPSVLLELLGRAPESRESAYDDSLKQSSPPPRPLFGGVVQPDGSVKYGNVSVHVKDTCPESALFEPPPLPGRRRTH